VKDANSEDWHLIGYFFENAIVRITTSKLVHFSLLLLAIDDDGKLGIFVFSSFEESRADSHAVVDPSTLGHQPSSRRFPCVLRFILGYR